MGLAACDADERTAGPESLPAPVLETVGLPPFSTTLGIANAGNPTNSVPLPEYPTSTVLARVTVSGLTTVTWNSGPQTGQLDTVLDARGRWSNYLSPGCYEGVAIQYSVSGSAGFPCSTSPGTVEATLTKMALLRGVGTASWTGGRPPVSCQDGPCHSYSGDKTISIEPVEVEFTVTAAPATVTYQDTVTITVAVSPWQVDGLNLPWNITSVQWVPAFGTQASPCAWSDFAPSSGGSPTRTCRKPFTRSGALTVFATVNGVQTQESVNIAVTPPELHVTASPSSIAGPDSVTFTASVTPPNIIWNLSSWTWRPDSGTGGISGNCVWTDKTCTRVCSKSGWMKATATIGGYSLADSAHVSRVQPCETGNPVLDSDEVQRGLNDLFWSSLGDGVERGGWLIQRSDGSYYVEPFPSEWSLPCGIDPPPETMPPDSAISWVHTHPWGTGEPQTACPGVKVGGVEVPRNYTNDSSEDDDATAAVWGPGWLIDKNLIRNFDQTHNYAGSYLEEYQRCGY